MVAEDAEFVTILAAVEGGSYRGPDGVRAWWEDDVLQMFTDVRFEPRDLIDFDGVVVGTVTIHARGRESALHVEQEFTHVIHLRDRKMVRFKSYLSREEALDAAGLSE
jgi:ketosteroid isomerase-like protein